MNFKHVAIVFLKEMKDTFRDKKSVMTNILLPLIMIPVLYYFMNMVQSSTQTKLEEEFKIGLVEDASYAKKEAFTKENIANGESLQIVKYKDMQEAKENLKQGNITCILDYHKDFFSNLEKGKTTKITILNNSTKSQSILGTQMLQTSMLKLNQSLAKEKLEKLNVSTELLNLVVSAEEDVADVGETSPAMMTLILIVPMYLISTCVSAGMPLALDIFAGERERNTFEALLSTKADRVSILVGKYLAVIAFSILSILTSFVGLIIGIAINKSMFGIEKGVSILEAFNMPLPALVLAALSALSLAVVFGGILIALSTYARSIKEAQTYMSYVMLPALIPAFITMMLQAGDVKMYMNFIPVLNTIAALKTVLGGVINYTYLFIGVGVNILFGVIVTMFVIRMFNNEKIVIK